MIRQLFKEFWLPLTAAGAWTAYNVFWGSAPEGGWTFGTVVNLLGPTFFFAAWIIGQWFRVRKQQRVERELGGIEGKVERMLDDLDTKTTNLIGHVTGGDSSPYLKVRTDQTNPLASALVTVIGRHTLREVSVKVECTSPFYANLGTDDIGTVPFGHARQLPINLSISGQNNCSLKLTFSALNGTTTQILHFQKVNGRWRFATVVFGHGKIVHDEVEMGFPNQPNWDTEIRLAGVTLGGKPYDPLA